MRRTVGGNPPKHAMESSGRSMKDPLFGNKLAGAVLVVLLLFIGLPVISNTFLQIAAGHHGHHYEEENPFGLAYQPYETLIGAAPAAQDEEVKVSLGCLLAEASADRGARAAAACKSCHSLEAGGPNGTGPALWNVVGREIASVDGFAYTGALQEMGGDWTYDRLDQYLYDSQAYVSGTNMQQKIRKDEKRADILAFLGQQATDSPVPFPACEPAGGDVAEAGTVDSGR